MGSLKSIFITVVFLICFSVALGYFLWYKEKFKPTDNTLSDVINIHSINNVEYIKVKNYGRSLRNTLTNSFNKDLCFLVDMSIPSGKKRFFVYNIKCDSILASGLVTHGSGCDKFRSSMLFSNEVNSNCTSLGKYKIGSSYYGRFGLAFKLYGLERSNSNAFDRFVVLHAHSCVPNEEVSPLPICKSLGCPTVSPEFLQKLKIYLESSGKPIILEIIK